MFGIFRLFGQVSTGDLLGQNTAVAVVRIHKWDNDYFKVCTGFGKCYLKTRIGHLRRVQSSTGQISWRSIVEVSDGVPGIRKS